MDEPRTSADTAPPAEASAAGQSNATPSDPLLPAMLYPPLSLTVGDGFKFGCGFAMALAIALLIGLLLLSLAALAASLAGVPLSFGR